MLNTQSVKAHPHTHLGPSAGVISLVTLISHLATTHSQSTWIVSKFNQLCDKNMNKHSYVYLGLTHACCLS